MMVKKASLDTSARLKKVLQSIRTKYGLITKLNAQVNHLRTRLFVDVYTYVEGIVATGQVRSAKHGQELLSKMLTINGHNIKNWYDVGRFMRNEKLNPDDVNAAAVVEARHIRASLKTADCLKIISALKKGAKRPEIKTLIYKGQVTSGSAVKHRINRLVASNLANRTGAKMELMVCIGILKRIFGDDGMLAFYDKNGVRQMFVGEDMAD